MKELKYFNNAKAIIALLSLGVIFVVFYKFMMNQDAFMDDPEALRNYVMFTIVGGGFLIGLLYLVSQTKHKVSVKTKKSKVVKASKKNIK
jgi:hypothetical protein